jgi:glucose/mannose transport system substrate-binding protein
VSRRITRRTSVGTAIAAVLALAVSACGTDEPTSAQTTTDRLEVVSWWTSGSEAPALGALLAAFRQQHPDVEAVNAAVAGGAGSKAIVALAKRLQQNDPPDVWQTFAGQSVQGYARRGAVRDLSSIFSGGLRSAMQPTIMSSLNRNGKPYGVPTGAHRSNVLWFNSDLLQQAGVTPPGDGYRLSTFLDDLAKVKASGAVPLCLGGKDAFTTVELFENMLLSTIGTNGWKNMVDDDLNWRSRPVRTALEQFGSALRYADPEAGRLTWDQATKKLATGGCAFETMNDSAYGELVAAGAQEGQDFGVTAFPGTADSFLAVVDVFVAATKAKNAKNALAFLSGINDPATQIAFSKAKGSVPVVRTADVSSLPTYQQDSSKSLWSLPVLLSVAHGEAMTPEFQEGFYNAVATYERTRDPDSFAADLETAVYRDRVPPR